MQSKYHQLTAMLKEMGFKPISTSVSENNPVECLKISFNPESRDEKLELIFTLFSPQEVSILLQDQIEFSLLNIICFLPLTFNNQSIEEAKFLANRLNAIALLPGFCIDENDQKAFYRYSLSLTPDVNRDLLKATINLIMSMIDIYGDPFIQIADGKLFDDFINEALTDYLADLNKLTLGRNQ